MMVNDEENLRLSCKPPGNPNCNRNTWDKYSHGCCSEEAKCGEYEGDCNSNSECLGSLICKPNSCPLSEDSSKKFDKRASCCQQPSYRLGKPLSVGSIIEFHCIIIKKVISK